MRLQTGKRQDGSLVWLVLDADFRPVEPVMKYLRYLESVQRSPNTIQAYASDLRLYWQFLHERNCIWSEVTLEDMSDFSIWLRCPTGSVTPIVAEQACRTEKTINRILGTVCSLYEFQERLTGEQILRLSTTRISRSGYKSFLHHAKRSRFSKRRLFKLKEAKRFTGCLSDDQVRILIEACKTLRDKFLLCLLYESGLRIGEVLGLFHEDLESGTKNVIRVVPRDHPNMRIRQKGSAEREVDVSLELMKLYSQYLIEEYPPEPYSNYVFVQSPRPGQAFLEPLAYSSVQSLFRRLERVTGIKASPHLMRHTHATELIRARWNMAYVQKRLGHAHVQTTINTYVHLTNQDLDEAYRGYLTTRDQGENASSAGRS